MAIKPPLLKRAIFGVVETPVYKFFQSFREPLKEAVQASLHSMLSKAGFTGFPQVYHSPFFATAKTFITPNIILVNSRASDSLLKNLLARETGHIVFEDFGRTRKRTEFRADRFAKFLSGDVSSLAEHVKENDRDFQQELELFHQHDGKLGRLEARFKQRARRQMYGTIEERLANLERPLTDDEIATFRKAITGYNRRVGASRSPAAIPSSPMPTVTMAEAEQAHSVIKAADTGSHAETILLENRSKRLR